MIMREDLENMSLDELRDLRKNLDRAISSFQDRKRQAAVAAAAEVAKSHGFRLTELLGDKVPRGTARRGAAARSDRLYVNPDNQDETWSGRGRRPRWINAALDAGRTLDDLAG